MGTGTLHGESLKDTKNEEIADGISPERFAEKGLHRESKIALWLGRHNGFPQANIFIYPQEIVLSEGRIRMLDQSFDDLRFSHSREFMDLSMEDLNKNFLYEARGLHSIFDLDYKADKEIIHAHFYIQGAEPYLRTIINSLKEK